jgi:hypothetical protein
MRTTRSASVLIAVVALATVLAACAGGSSAPILSTVGNALPAASAAAAVREGTGQSAASAAPAPADGVGAAVDDAKIIRTGTIDLEVRDVPVALRTARDGIRALGGYVGASNTSNSEDDHPIATITYRIPADRWEEALDLLRGLNGQTTKVVSEQTEAVEVTGQVIDMQARIQNLRASETALQAIARTAVKVSDVLEVQAQLTSVRGEIEVLAGQLKDLTDRAAFATLTANFGVPVVAVELAKKGWDPAAAVDEASASLIDIVQALATAGIWFGIVWLPILVVLGLVVGFAAWILRRIGVIGRRGQGSVTPTA